jgi:uncharacterized MAPEG superfamily protein
MSLSAYLLLSVGLFFVMLAVQAIASDAEHGLAHNAGARDGAVDKSVFVQRAKRANQNMIESMVMFVPLILLAIQTDNTGKYASIGAAMFFFGRLAYAPLYWFGVPWLRSAAWFVSIIGIILIFINLLPLI